MAGLGFGEALGIGIAFVLLLGVLLFASLGLLTLTTILYGLRTDVTATVVGFVASLLAGLATDLGGASTDVVVASLPLGFGVGSVAWRSVRDGEPRRLLTGSISRYFLLALAVGTVACGVLSWVVVVGFLGADLATVVAESPAAMLRLGAITGLTVGVGGYALYATSGSG